MSRFAAGTLPVKSHREQPRQRPETPPYAARLDPTPARSTLRVQLKSHLQPLTHMEAQPAVALSVQPLEGHVALARSTASGLSVGAGAVALAPAKAGDTPYPGKGMA